MKHIKLFENFENANLLEGWMSEIDIIRQESPTRERFKEELKKLFTNHKNKAVVTAEDFLEGLAKEIYDTQEVAEN